MVNTWSCWGVLPLRKLCPLVWWTNQTYNSSCKFEMSRSLHKRQPAAASTAYWYVRTARWWSLVRNKLLSLCIITHFNLYTSVLLPVGQFRATFLLYYLFRLHCSPHRYTTSWIAVGLILNSNQSFNYNSTKHLQSSRNWC